MFTPENTSGYSADDLTQINAEWRTIVESEGLDEEEAPDEWKHYQARLLVDWDQRHPQD